MYKLESMMSMVNIKGVTIANNGEGMLCWKSESARKRLMCGGLRIRRPQKLGRQAIFIVSSWLSGDPIGWSVTIR